MLRKFLLNFCLLPQDFGRMNLFAENILVISRCNVIMTSQWRHKQWLTFMRTAGESNSTTFPFSRMTILSLWIIVFSLWAIVRTVDSLNSSVICFLVEFSFRQFRRSGQLNEKFEPPGNCSKRIRSCINASVFKSTFAVASSINKILLFLRIARPFQSHQYFKTPTHWRKSIGASFLNKAVAFHQHSSSNHLHLRYSQVLVQLIPFLSGSVSEMTHKYDRLNCNVQSKSSWNRGLKSDSL